MQKLGKTVKLISVCVFLQKQNKIIDKSTIL
jgi:hypothetical protein